MCVRPILTMSFHAFDFRGDRIAQRGDRGNEALLHVDGRGDAHGRRERVVRRLRHVDVIVGVNRRVAAKRRASDLAAAVGDHLVDVHVELGAAAGHPDVQRKHVAMLAGEDFVAGLNDQLVALIVEPLAVVVGDGGGLLQGRVGRDHLAGNQVLPDAEMFKRTLGLRAPQLVGGYFDAAEAISLFSHVGHWSSPMVGVSVTKGPDQLVSWLRPREWHRTKTSSAKASMPVEKTSASPRNT